MVIVSEAWQKACESMRLADRWIEDNVVSPALRAWALEFDREMMKGAKLDMHELTKAYCSECGSEDVTITKLRTGRVAPRSMDDLEKGPSNHWIPSKYRAVCDSCGYERTYTT